MKLRSAIWILWLTVALVHAQGTLKGRVLSAVSWQAHPGRRGFPWSKGIVPSPRIPSGRFQMDSLPPGSYDLLVRHGEYEAALNPQRHIAGRCRRGTEVELFPPSVSLEDKKVSASPVRKIYDMPNSTHVMDAEEIRRTPGALMDVQRVVQKFPGVQARGDNVNEIIARGGFPGENLFILDKHRDSQPQLFSATREPAAG